MLPSTLGSARHAYDRFDHLVHFGCLFDVNDMARPGQTLVSDRWRQAFGVGGMQNAIGLAPDYLDGRRDLAEAITQ
jgi:hypothetical protein